MTIEAWALFCLTETLLCLNPGPSSLLVVSLGLTRGRVPAALASAGVIAANAVYFALSASGLAAVHRVSAEAFSLVKWSGAAYMIWTGGRMILRSFRSRGPGEAAAPAAPRRRPFSQGFVAQGANPNLLIYFGAILPQFVDPAAALAPQLAILAASSFAIELTVLNGYAALAARAGRRAAPRFRALLERVGGGLLVGAGVGLARMRRG